jgi:hypothetical protein
MAYQFVHVSTYSIKTGGAGVAAEAGRLPSHCLHVDDPQAPVLLAGAEPVEAWKEIERRHSATKNTVVVKGVERERGLRADENIMLAAVVSYPDKMADTDINSPAFQKWQSDSMEFLTKRHGKPLSAVLHLDESHAHIHFITAPDLENGQRMRDIHPGEAAKAAAGGKAAKKTVKDHAYKQAMQAYQDDFFTDVGRPSDQARTGPKARRKSRQEWLAEQDALKLLAEQHLKADKRDSAFAEQLAAQQEKINQQKAMIAEQKLALLEERKALDAERKALDVERDAIKKERDDLAKLRDSLASKETALKARISAINEKNAEQQRALKKRSVILDRSDKAQLLSDNKRLKIDLVSATYQRYRRSYRRSDSETEKSIYKK